MRRNNSGIMHTTSQPEPSKQHDRRKQKVATRSEGEQRVVGAFRKIWSAADPQKVAQLKTCRKVLVYAAHEYISRGGWALPSAKVQEESSTAGDVMVA